MGAVRLALCLSIIGRAQAQEVPFDRLLSGVDRTDLKWNVTVKAPALSNFQRLCTRISMRVDGQEITARNARGKFLFAAEFKDSGDHPFRTHTSVDLASYDKATAQNELECVVTAFVLPGNYTLTLAVIDPATEKFSLTHRTMRVAPVSGDPLPDIWKDAPGVEFVDVPDTPDVWFLPQYSARLSLPLENRRPTRVDILANVSPTESSRRQTRTYNRNMDAIVPSLKVLSAMEIRDGTKDFSLIDIERRRVSYEQHGVRE